MAAIDWPAAFPQYVEEGSFNYEVGEETIRSENDIGPAKVRRRTTRGIDKFSCAVLIPNTQVADVKDFYKTGTNGGSNRFNFIDPISRNSVEVRFTAPPKFDPAGGLTWRATLSLEVLG